jgi:hypothetical protein
VVQPVWMGVEMWERGTTWELIEVNHFDLSTSALDDLN